MKVCVPVEQIGLNVFKAQCLETGILSRGNPPYEPDTTSQELKRTEEFLRSRSTIAKYSNLHEAESNWGGWNISLQLQMLGLFFIFFSYLGNFGHSRFSGGWTRLSDEVRLTHF